MSERHQQHHRALADLEERIERVVAARYAQLKQRGVRAPRRDAHRSARSQHTTLYYAWRTHVKSEHGHRIGPFISLVELKTLHEQLHNQEES